MSIKPIVVETFWHNCSNCKIHYMSESPHIRAYLCDECWFSMPHYKTKIKEQQKPDRGPTYEWWTGTDWPLSWIIAYIWGCSMCLLIIAYYLFEK